MSKINENSTLNVKFVVKPILFTMYHLNAYMGPCRYGEGYALTTEADMETTQREFEIFKEELKDLDPDNVELLEPIIVHWNEDFALKESEMQRALEDDDKTDFYLIRGLRISSYFAVELAKRTDKPIGHTPNKSAFSKCDHVDMTAHLYAEGKKGYAFLDFEEMNRTFAALRVKRALASTKVFFPLKSAMLTFGCQSSYLTLEGVTEKFGVRFAHVNSDEVFQWMDRLTEEEKERAARLAETLAANSQGVHMPVEYIKNDTEYFETIKKMMKHYDCNAFTMPCFEVCATRELDKRKLTFCLAHSLFKDEGIASACAGDVGSVLTITILMNIARKAPYMGNTMVLDKNTNQCRTLHDVACAKMKGYDQPDLPTEFVSFTLNSWGTTMRYDFSRDNGETMTLVNLSPDMKKIMVAKATINGCDDYLTPECKHAVRYTVNDAVRFHECQKYVGHHFALVYGDYVQEVKDFAKECELEVLEA